MASSSSSSGTPYQRVGGTNSAPPPAAVLPSVDEAATLFNANESPRPRSPGRMRVTRDNDPAPPPPTGCCAIRDQDMVITDLAPFEQGRPCYLVVFPIFLLAVLAMFFLHLEFELVLLRTLDKEKIEEKVQKFLPAGASYFRMSLESMRDRLYVSEFSVALTIGIVLFVVYYVGPKMIANRFVIPIKTPISLAYVWRGASFAVLLAFVLEAYGQVELMKNIQLKEEDVDPAANGAQEKISRAVASTTTASIGSLAAEMEAEEAQFDLLSTHLSDGMELFSKDSVQSTSFASVPLTIYSIADYAFSNVCNVVAALFSSPGPASGASREEDAVASLSPASASERIAEKIDDVPAIARTSGSGREVVGSGVEENAPPGSNRRPFVVENDALPMNGVELENATTSASEDRDEELHIINIDKDPDEMTPQELARHERQYLQSEDDAGKTLRLFDAIKDMEPENDQEGTPLEEQEDRRRGLLHDIRNNEPKPEGGRNLMSQEEAKKLLSQRQHDSPLNQDQGQQKKKKKNFRDILNKSQTISKYPGLILGVMFFAALFEEIAKLLTLLFAFARVKEEILSTPTCCFCHSCGFGDCRGYIVRRFEAFVFYGVCVGLGFMLTENVKYFTMIGLSPDIGFHREEAETETYWMRRFLALVRNLFNLHPFLTGCAAARIAPFLYHRAEVAQHPLSSPTAAAGSSSSRGQPVPITEEAAGTSAAAEGEAAPAPPYQSFVRIHHNPDYTVLFKALWLPVLIHTLYDAGSVFIMLISPWCLLWFPVLVSLIAMVIFYFDVVALRTLKIDPDFFLEDAPNRSGVNTAGGGQDGIMALQSVV
ncbi:unnamed protein product [Amoebophrya sp. A120]|nr:unnamed protein product [Amoebophrya sp. A120]|eukprot:GSA120T00004250001.1